MKPGSLLRSAAILGAGYAVAAGFFWAFLNVPESNVFALLLSATLAALVILAAGITTALASALSPQAPVRAALRGTACALPGFVGGLAVFAILWWLTASADAWWRAHLGEIDATLLRYLGATSTGWVHQTAHWTLWLARWVIGLSVIAALVTALSRSRGVVSGLRASVRLAPVAAMTLAVVAVGEGLWRLAYWRPRGLPPNQAEAVFAATKLALLYAATMVIAALVLEMYRRAAADAAATAPPATTSPPQPG